MIELLCPSVFSAVDADRIKFPLVRLCEELTTGPAGLRRASGTSAHVDGFNFVAVYSKLGVDFCI